MCVCHFCCLLIRFGFIICITFGFHTLFLPFSLHFGFFFCFISCFIVSFMTASSVLRSLHQFHCRFTFSSWFTFISGLHFRLRSYITLCRLCSSSFVYPHTPHSLLDPSLVFGYQCPAQIYDADIDHSSSPLYISQSPPPLSYVYILYI